MRGHSDRDRRVDPREFLDRDRVGQRVPAGAAPALGDREPHQAELGEALHDLVREPVLPVDLLGDWPDLLLGELPDRPPDQLVLFAELEVHTRPARSTISRTPQPVPPTCER